MFGGRETETKHGNVSTLATIPGTLAHISDSDDKCRLACSEVCDVGAVSISYKVKPRHVDIIEQVSVTASYCIPECMMLIGGVCTW